MLILTVSIQWEDILPITSRSKPWRQGFFQMEKRAWRLGEGGSWFFLASTDPKQCLWIWNLHSFHCSENLTLARNMNWDQCKFFCCLWCASVHFPKLRKHATQGVIFRKIHSFMTMKMKPYFWTLTLYASGSPGFSWSRMDTKSVVWQQELNKIGLVWGRIVYYFDFHLAAIHRHLRDFSQTSDLTEKILWFMFSPFFF